MLSLISLSLIFRFYLIGDVIIIYNNYVVGVRMKRAGLILGFITILIVVVMVSGCTSTKTGNRTNQTDDLQGDPPTVTHRADGSVWISGNLGNKGNSTYTDVDVLVNGYDLNRNMVYQEKTTIEHINPGGIGGFIITLPEKEANIEYVEMKVLNATKT